MATLAARSVLVAELRTRLSGQDFPRLTVVGIVLGSAATAFLCSALTLWAGLRPMGVRYLLAALAGYLAFILLIRGWIAYKRSGFGLDVQMPDLALEVPSFGRGSTPAPGSLFGGGRSGGGGMSGTWNSGSVTRVSSGGWSAGDLMPDLDDVWWLVLAAVLAIGGLIAVIYVVYAAPVLLAEVALDAALVTPIYSRLRREDAGTWVGTVVRRTWIPAALVILFAAGVGTILQYVVPDARSIGDVVRSLRR